MKNTMLSNITSKVFAIIISLTVIIASTNANAQSVFKEEIIKLESQTEGRLGIFAINTQNGNTAGYRESEIFPTGCTSKVMGVAAVLHKSISNPSLLSQQIKYSKGDLDGWAPITKEHVADGMSIQELCAASISYSDNTAMNLLLKSIDGIKGMNNFARSIDNNTFSQDNDWPAEAYSGGAGNKKDSSTPKDMVESLEKLTVGDALGRPQKDLLTTWLIATKTGSARIKAGTPKNWIVGNKTGTGGFYGSTNDLAIVWPPEHQPLLIGIYYTSDNKNASKREDVIAAATKIVIDELIAHDDTLRAN